MNEIWDLPAARVVMNVALLAVVVAVGFYLIGRFRSRYRQSEAGASNLLDNFRELHTRGQLSDEEYRNIKSKLAARLRAETSKAEQAE